MNVMLSKFLSLMFANGAENCQLMMWKMLHAYNSSTVSLVCSKNVHYIVFSAHLEAPTHAVLHTYVVAVVHVHVMRSIQGRAG